MVNIKEKQLIELIKLNDHGAFEQLIIDYEKKVYALCYQILHNEEDAKDAAQEVFIKIYKSINKFNYKSNFSTWLYRITVNVCLDSLRKNKNKHLIYTIDNDSQQYVDLKNLTPENNLIKNEKVATIYFYLDKLKDKYRVLIILRDVHGFSYDEISKITKTNIGTIKSRLSRARKQLKKLLIHSELFENINV